VNKLVPGLYEQLLTEALREPVLALGDRAETVDLDVGDADAMLSSHVAAVLGRVLRALPNDKAKLQRQLEVCNAVLGEILRHSPQALADLATPAEPRALHAVHPSGVLGVQKVERPSIPLSRSDLLVNAANEPTVGRELAKELESADAVDLICAFVQWNGVRILEKPLQKLRDRGAKLRVITTTYMGATQRRALDLLVEMGAEVKVAYETPPARTRLHAKAWLFHRRSGFSTAFVGSSNLSHSALMAGLEWNVRLSQVETGPILEKFRATFDGYWEDPDFESYDPQRDAERFDRAVQSTQTKDDGIDVGFFDLHPHPHQREILDTLTVERERHGRTRNLVVAATGTGKTVIAALDYRRLREKHGSDLSLLFVAHRDQILQQSRRTFRTALRDGAFGELYVGGEKPSTWRHVFGSIQSLSQFDPTSLPAEHFDVVIVDEFHHAAAPSYRKLLDHVKPRYLLGLTATPERTDGLPIDTWFGGRIAAELRLWDALERNLLVPFQYFGVHDDVPLDQLAWEKGGYRIRELENVYTGNDVRVAKILQAIKAKVIDPLQMRALGFCVSVEHAIFMADRFTKAKIPSAAVHANTSPEERRAALRDLRLRKLNVLFAVDLFNEGVDIPEVDTVLLLRPTESSTVFLQQLGRGLRLHESKSCLTVLDFIGQQHRKFRFDLRYHALTGKRREELPRAITEGFPFLPAGCHIELDRVAQQIILDNVRESVGTSKKQLVAMLKELGDVSLSEFLERTGTELDDIYKRGTWSDLRRAAGFAVPPAGPDEKRFGDALGRLLHMDDRERLHAYARLLETEQPSEWASGREALLVRMLLLALWDEGEVARDLRTAWEKIWLHPALRSEFVELCGVLDQRATVVPRPLDRLDLPLWVHCRYARNEILGAFGWDKPSNMRQGVMYDEERRCDVFFITLRKTESDYSPSTLYRDYPISQSLFHWESQSTTSVGSKTGQRYIHHREQGSHVLLFVREAKKDAQGRTMPYVFLGPARYVKHEGERPMAIVWRLDHEMPTQLFMDAKAAAG